MGGGGARSPLAHALPPPAVKAQSCRGIRPFGVRKLQSSRLRPWASSLPAYGLRPPLLRVKVGAEYLRARGGGGVGVCIAGQPDPHQRLRGTGTARKYVP